MRVNFSLLLKELAGLENSANLIEFKLNCNTYFGICFDLKQQQHVKKAAQLGRFMGLVGL